MARKLTAASSQSTVPRQTLLSAYFAKSSPTPTPTSAPLSAETRNREVPVTNGSRRPAAVAIAGPPASSSSAPSSPSHTTLNIQSKAKLQNGASQSSTSIRTDDQSQSVTASPLSSSANDGPVASLSRSSSHIKLPDASGSSRSTTPHTPIRSTMNQPNGIHITPKASTSQIATPPSIGMPTTPAHVTRSGSSTVESGGASCSPAKQTGEPSQSGPASSAKGKGRQEPIEDHFHDHPDSAMSEDDANRDDVEPDSCPDSQETEVPLCSQPSQARSQRIQSPQTRQTTPLPDFRSVPASHFYSPPIARSMEATPVLSGHGLSIPVNLPAIGAPIVTPSGANGANRTRRSWSLASQSNTKAPTTPDRSSASRFLRSPSNSSLSSLDPSPVKPSPVKIGSPPTRKPHSFVLEVPLTRVRDRTTSLTPRRKRRARSDSSDSDESSGSASASDSDDEALKAALCRAAARRAEGKALNSEPSNSVSTSHDGDDRRRSFRPRAALGALTTNVAKPKHDFGFGGSSSATRGGFSIAALKRERDAKAARGVSEAWIEGKRLMMNASDSDSSDEDALADPFASTLTADQVDEMAKVAADVVVDPDLDPELIGSPEKRDASDRSRAMARVLKDDLGKSPEAKSIDEVVQQRVCWRKEIRATTWTRMTDSDDEEMTGPLTEAILRAIEGQYSCANGRRDASRFPAPIVLLPGRARHSLDDYKIGAQHLLSLICHPHTNSELAERGHALLDRIIVREASSAPPRDALFTALELEEQLRVLGLKTDALSHADPERLPPSSPLTDLDDEDSTPQPQQPIVTDEQRVAAVTRLVRVVQALASSRPNCVLKLCDIAPLVTVFVRLALDPSAAPMRGSLEAVLRSLLDAVTFQDTATRRSIFSRLLGLYPIRDAHLHVEVLRALPRQSEVALSLRAALAWGWLFNVEATPSSKAHGHLDDPHHRQAHLKAMLRMLTSPKSDGPFMVTRDVDDTVLYYNAQLLSIALSDVVEGLYDPDPEQRRAIRELVEQIFTTLNGIENRIREYGIVSQRVPITSMLMLVFLLLSPGTDVRHGNPMRNRAKNALTRVAHALTYAWRAAKGQNAGLDFSSITNAVIENEEQQGGGLGASTGPRFQTTLDSIFAKRPRLIEAGGGE
ncbi:BZ3500_MvSof-1268-A1-R1_Chr9g10602 [Microbotryum saponariae]|uniref:BZ3500_MvSof-1268-A1-R1_Chr9g10602 protein n=1 Tax=Microbotryum saponariae TaxID=289078 RepID=A0A2X0L1F0_9BASI|nr:BZ3501_MvSof-1269-A2-R1_Chr9g10350 [Microbotryum saponariae]SDA00371.1 BZ3500_MvSof-1268-A1-R1_Chr9g10602 [Microbotryum saponariae]